MSVHLTMADDPLPAANVVASAYRPTSSQERVQLIDVLRSFVLTYRRF